MDEFNDSEQARIAAMETHGLGSKSLSDVRNELASERNASNAKESAKLSFFMSTATDIGGGHVNQDDCGVWVHRKDETTGNPLDFVLAVFDGHGRELGQLASEVAKESMRVAFAAADTWKGLRTSPEETMKTIFSDAHFAIKQVFKDKYLAAGWQVEERKEGYVTKRPHDGAPWTCTHGGTTATVVAILDGHRMIVSNVGDSTALWGGFGNNGASCFKELSAEHSPESVDEYLRCLRSLPEARAVEEGAAGPPAIPQLRFVYDAPSFSKNQCPTVFKRDPMSPKGYVRTEKGSYYKNVRNEWASLVTTPPYARFQDALAFTRSLGDLHLQSYGVSYEPETVTYDLFELHKSAMCAKSTAGSESVNASVLLVCSDGVWDNWKFGEIVTASMQQPWIDEVCRKGDAVEVTNLLMKWNLQLARAHFGSQADNMTAIVCYLTSPLLASPDRGAGRKIVP